MQLSGICRSPRPAELHLGECGRGPGPPRRRSRRAVGACPVRCSAASATPPRRAGCAVVRRRGPPRASRRGRRRRTRRRGGGPGRPGPATAPCAGRRRGPGAGHRPREATPDEDQPEPGLGRGAGARVGPRRRVDHPPDTPGVGVPDREVQQHVRVERPAGQRVDGDDTLGRGQTPREVERGSDTRGDPDAADLGHLVGVQDVAADEHTVTGAGSGVRRTDGHLGRCSPRCARRAEQLGGRVSAEHGVGSGPAVRRERAEP